MLLAMTDRTDPNSEPPTLRLTCVLYLNAVETIVINHNIVTHRLGGEGGCDSFLRGPEKELHQGNSSLAICILSAWVHKRRQ